MLTMPARSNLRRGTQNVRNGAFAGTGYAWLAASRPEQVNENAFIVVGRGAAVRLVLGCVSRNL